MTIPARITGIMSSSELDDLRAQAAAQAEIAATSERANAAIAAYMCRTPGPDGRQAENAATMFRLVHGIEGYLRNGGDPAIAAVLQGALNISENC